MSNQPIPTGLNGTGAPIPLGDATSRSIAVTDLPQFQHLRDAAARTGPRPRFTSQPTSEQLDQAEAFSTHRVAAAGAARRGALRAISSLEAAIAQPASSALDGEGTAELRAEVAALRAELIALRVELLKTREIADGAAAGGAS
jgi:hypothetical protein